MTTVQQLRTTLHPGYTVGPRVHLGTFYEIDVLTDKTVEAPTSPGRATGNGDGETVTAWTNVELSVAVEVEPDEEYEYAVYMRGWLGVTSSPASSAQLPSPLDTSP